MTSMEPMEVAISRALVGSQKRICTAESCTGGLIAHRLTNVVGASEYFEGGIVAYHNRVKERELNVQTATLDRFGAVSEETAREMAAGARARFGVRYSVAVTGVAGPGGGTREKPVGLVFIAVADGEEVEVRRFNFVGTREAVKDQTADAALAFLWEVVCR